jgi:D-alanyl-D-alanine carboxypeptidase
VSGVSQPETVSLRSLSDALAALGAYAEPPTDADMAAAIEAEGKEALTARLANALYGVALTHVMTAEYVAVEARDRRRVPQRGVAGRPVSIG